MRTISLILLGIGACGPIYPDQPARQPASDPSQVQGPPVQGPPVQGPPGGAADPWSGGPPPSDPREPSGPADPYGAPNDPYAASAPSGRAAPRPAPPAPRPAAPPAPAPRPAPAPPARPTGLPSDAQALLDAHNRVRAQHCAPALTWSPQLAQVAQQWANSLRNEGCKFGHSAGRYGENLAAGTSGTLDGQSVTGMWYDELKQYSFPNGGFSMQTGHFTQVVWRETTQMGCGKSTCNGMDIFVCEYDPPGNVQGMYRQNVLPPGCK